jgi:hypothetical protein
MFNATLVRTDPGYVNAVSPTFEDGLLNWTVALFVGAEDPTLNVERYAIDAACCTGVIVPATIWSNRRPVCRYGT